VQGQLADRLNETPYDAYLYSYPHKTAYRPLSPAVSLEQLWAPENRDALFLYIHVPFCEMRCGFCNLFTAPKPQDEMISTYLRALERQARAVKAALGQSRFVRFALGGGTPTTLDVAGLAEVLDIAERTMGADLHAIPCSAELSPETVTPEKLALFKERGIDRVSIGVQSFFDAEARSVFRPQRRTEVERALGWMKSSGFPVVNIDLIYGLPGQTPETWITSLKAALHFEPEELYLYPLYVRPLTGLGKSSRQWDDSRLELYRLGRDLLRSAGYTQVSMRMFRAKHAPSQDGPVYCCQQDGMVGLGSGARSYTEHLHYSSEYAVGARGVSAIIDDYSQRDGTAFAHADYGFRLDHEDRRRRYLILSLLEEGLAFDAYQQRFGHAAEDDFPALSELVETGLATRTARGLLLTEAGVERSDSIGPWLHSNRVVGLMQSYELR